MTLASVGFGGPRATGSLSVNMRAGNIQEILGDLRALDSQLVRMIDLTMSDTADEYAANVRKQVRRKLRQSGGYARSIYKRKIATARYNVWTDFVGAALHEHGGTIRARGRGRTYRAGRTKGGAVRMRTSKGSHLVIPVGPWADVMRAKRGRTGRGIVYLDEIVAEAVGGQEHSTWVEKGVLMLDVAGRVQPIAVVRRSVRHTPVPIWGPEAERAGNHAVQKLDTRVTRLMRRRGWR